MFGFIEREKANHKVKLMCDVLGVSPSGYYAWHSRPPCQRRRDDERLQRLIAAIHRFSRAPTYGHLLPQRGKEIAGDFNRLLQKRRAA